MIYLACVGAHDPGRIRCISVVAGPALKSRTVPRIVNSQANGNASIADSLRDLGDSMFTDQSQKALIRETALKGQRENANRPLAADDLARGDYAAAAQHGFLAGIPASDIAGYNQFNQVMQNGPASIAGTTATMAVPGTAYDNTVEGARAANATRIEQQRIASERAAAAQVANTNLQIQGQQWQDQHTLVNLRAPDGSIKMVPKSQVGYLQTQGYDVMPSLDDVKANAVSQVFRSPPPAPSVAPAPAPSTSVLNPASIWGP
jgi:hypothetical protein